MGETYNAIRVSGQIIKTHIDFSSFEGLKESSGFKRLYTIHTQKTIDLSHILGFKVAGFCDDHGYGGPQLAADIAGYPSLPSDLILCGMDDQYNFLPLSEAEVEALYVYLKEGKKIADLPEAEDALEEVEEEDLEDRFTLHVLEVAMDSHWLNSEDSFAYQFHYAYLIEEVEEGEEAPYFPYYDDLIKEITVDRLHDTVMVTAHLDKDYVFELKKDAFFEIAFDYLPRIEVPTSRRVGKVRFTLRIDRFIDAGQNRKAIIHKVEEDLDANEVILDEEEYVTFFNERNNIADVEISDDRIYDGYLLSESGNYGIVRVKLKHEADEKKHMVTYVPVHQGEENFEHYRLANDEDNHLLSVKINIHFEK